MKPCERPKPCNVRTKILIIITNYKKNAEHRILYTDGLEVPQEEAVRETDCVHRGYS